MTEIEVKALALVNEIEVERYSVKRMPEIRRKAYTLDEALCRAIEREAATEARHAAELREQAERFDAFRREVSDELAKLGCWPDTVNLQRFILPKPDPLVEALASLPVGFAGCVDGADALRAAMQARGYEWRKIGEAGE